MSKEKGLSNSTYAALISVSLLAAIVLLSTTMNSTQKPNLLKDTVSLPGEGPVLPGVPGGITQGDPLQNNTDGGGENSSDDGSGDRNQTREPTDQPSSDGGPAGGGGIIEKISRAIFKALGGLMNGQNQRESSNVSKEEPRGNFSQPDNLTDPSQPDPGNLTEPSRPQKNGSQDGRHDQGGFLSSLLENSFGLFNDLFSGGSESGETKKQEDRQSNKDGGSKKGELGNMIPDLGMIPSLIGLIGLLTAAIIIYRSDSSPVEILKAVLRRVKLFILGIPDLFRRAVVGLVNSSISLIRSLVEKLRKLVYSPRLFFEKLKQKWRRRAEKVEEETEEIGDKGVKEYFKERFTEAGEQLEGIDRVWLNLKEKAGLGRKTSLSPREVGDKARKDLPESMVDEIVDAFRLEKYSSHNFSKKERIRDWLEDLEDDRDE
jgi:hypothetical protein